LILGGTMDRRSFLKSLMKVGSAATIGSIVQACTPNVDPIVAIQPTPSPSPQLLSTNATQTDDVQELDPTLTPTAPDTITPTDESLDFSKIALVIADDRSTGVLRALQLLSMPSFSGKEILVKPNFNSSDPAPGSTHPDVLRTLINRLKDEGAQRIIVGDRSGMGNTREVFSTIGVFQMADELGFETLIFDELEQDQWEYLHPEGSNWKQGFAVPKLLNSVDAVVQACCLKTHRYGGHFTMSLKNSVGLVAKKVPGDRHDYMIELHTSRNQRKMIAEVNSVYSPDLVIMDGVEAFTTGGPAKGKLVKPGVILAGVDRVALDALGVAILRKYGTTRQVRSGKIFEQAQLARAVELEIGTTSADKISIISDEPRGDDLAEELMGFLVEG
jgi:uncharacterized protein (DUF362 family)